MATVLPLKTAWIADILSQASQRRRDIQRQRCWKRGSGDDQRVWDYDTTVRSFNAVSALCVTIERQGSTLTWTVWKAIGGSAPIAKSSKFVRRAHSRTAFDCERRQSYAFSHRGAHFCLKGGWQKRERFDVAGAVNHQSPAAKATNSDRCGRA